MKLPELFSTSLPTTGAFVWIGNERSVTQDGFAVSTPGEEESTSATVAYAGNADDRQLAEALEGAYATNYAEHGLDGEARASILERAAEVYRQEMETAADLITAEAGLCHRQARYEVKRSINCLEAAAVQARQIDQQDLTQPFRSPEDRAEIDFEVISEPLDLAVAITPFNHPLNQVVHKVAPAIAAGTCLVLKPSEKTPLSAYYLADVLARCGLPPHALNVVSGPPEQVVPQLVCDPRVELVCFTGGVEIGKKIARLMASGGNELVRYVPELGGNSALVILADADLNQAANLALGAFDNAGQRCTAVKRLLIDERVADAFLEIFVPRAAALRCDDPWLATTDLGPTIDVDAARRVEGRVDAALASGAELLIGHRRRGAFYPPTVLDRVQPDMELVRAETFGPVAPLIRISGLDQAIDIVRAGRYRLAGAIVTADDAEARRYARAIGVGQFSHGGAPGFRTESAPFGGFGDSGNGEKEGIVCATRNLRRLRTYYRHPVCK